VATYRAKGGKTHSGRRHKESLEQSYARPNGAGTFGRGRRGDCKKTWVEGNG